MDKYKEAAIKKALAELIALSNGVTLINGVRKTLFLLIIYPNEKNFSIIDLKIGICARIPQQCLIGTCVAIFERYEDLRKSVKDCLSGYKEDPMFSNTLDQPGDHPSDKR